MYYKAEDLLCYLFDNKYLNKKEWIRNSDDYREIFYLDNPTRSITLEIKRVNHILCISIQDFESKADKLKISNYDSFIDEIKKFII